MLVNSTYGEIYEHIGAAVALEFGENVSFCLIANTCGLSENLIIRYSLNKAAKSAAETRTTVLICYKII